MCVCGGGGKSGVALLIFLQIEVFWWEQTNNSQKLLFLPSCNSTGDINAADKHSRFLNFLQQSFSAWK